MLKLSIFYIIFLVLVKKLMTIDNNKKILIFCICFITSAASVLLNIFFIILVCLIFFSIIVKIKLNISKHLIIFYLSVFLLAGLYTFFKSSSYDQLYDLTPSTIYLEGRIVSLPQGYTDYKTKFELAPFRYGENSANKWNLLDKSKTIVTIYNFKQALLPKLNIGDIVRLKGKLKKPYANNNPAVFNYRNYLRNKKIFTTFSAKAEEVKLIRRPINYKWKLIQNLNIFREKILNIHKYYLNPSELEILGGMVFGDHAVPSKKETKDNFIKSGLFHLLAASGMNVALIFCIWFFIAKNIGIPRRLNIALGGLIVLLYLFLTGMPPSVFRATIMMEFILFGKFIDKNTDLLTLLSMAAFLMIIWDPLYLLNISFQLSFIVTFGLILCIEACVNKLKPIPVAVSGAVVVPIIAQIWVAPIQAYYFNTFATYSILANIIVTPFVGFITFLGFISSILCIIPFVGQYICFWFDVCALPLIKILLFTSSFFAKLPCSIIHLPSPELGELFVIYLIILSISVYMYVFARGKQENQIEQKFFKKVVLGILFSCIVYLCFIFIQKYFDNNLKITFFNIKNANTFLIKTPEKKYVLVNPTNLNKKKYTPAKSVLLPYFTSKGIKQIDKIITLSSNLSFRRSLVQLVKQIKIKELYIISAKNSNQLSEIKSICDQSEIDLYVVKQSDIALDNFKTFNFKVANIDQRLSIEYKKFNAKIYLNDIQAYIDTLNYKNKMNINAGAVQIITNGERISIKNFDS